VDAGAGSASIGKLADKTSKIMITAGGIWMTIPERLFLDLLNQQKRSSVRILRV
jgi:hypothetical protein